MPNLKREEELNISLSVDQWEFIFCRLHKGSLNVLTQENGYKLYSRWYKTPYIIKKINPNVSSLCWRCNSTPGTLWWDCIFIKPFWEKIHNLISYITTYIPDYTAEQYLLHHSSLPNSVYKNSIVLHLINAAKLCIPIKWSQSSPPTISDWLHKVQHIANMEALIHQSKDSSKSFYNKWACWFNFTKYKEFQLLMDNWPQFIFFTRSHALTGVSLVTNWPMKVSVYISRSFSSSYIQVLLSLSLSFPVPLLSLSLYIIVLLTCINGNVLLPPFGS